jgi:hypothetical protein
MSSSSKFAPPSQNGESRLHFGEFEIYASAKQASTGNEYFEFEAFITPPEAQDQIKKRKLFSFSEDYRKVTWPSIETLVTNKHITGPDDIFTDLGKPSKKFYACYRTPKYLQVATAKDIEYARTNNRMENLEANSFGQLCKVAYPIKFEKVFTTQEDYNNAYLVHKTTTPVQAAPVAPTANPEYAQALMMLPAFISNSGLDLGKLEGMLQHPPFSTLGLTLQSQEVKHEVAKAIIAKVGPTDDNAIKGMLLSLNGGGYLDIESTEIVAAREGVPF